MERKPFSPLTNIYIGSRTWPTSFLSPHGRTLSTIHESFFEGPYRFYIYTAGRECPEPRHPSQDSGVKKIAARHRDRGTGAWLPCGGSSEAPTGEKIFRRRRPFDRRRGPAAGYFHRRLRGDFSVRAVVRCGRIIACWLAGGARQDTLPGPPVDAPPVALPAAGRAYLDGPLHRPVLFRCALGCRALFSGEPPTQRGPVGSRFKKRNRPPGASLGREGRSNRSWLHSTSVTVLFISSRPDGQKADFNYLWHP